jgi:tRNA-Thr(GGU) m(6)t(6)A37 methyltransferase TsaA
MAPVKFEPIGIIHSPFTQPRGVPIQPAAARDIGGTIEIFEQFRPGLCDLEGFSHIIVLYHFHLSKGYSLKVTPFLDNTPRGVFATRAPRRPNPTGLSIVQLDRIEDGTLYISGADMVDQTPVLDIKPYIPKLNPAGDIRIGWLAEKERHFNNKKADGRMQSQDL